jgi:hypothetical protein
MENLLFSPEFHERFKEDEALGEAFVTLVRAIPSERRGAIIDALRHNEFFCGYCGEDTERGRLCHCTNDE